MSHLSASKPEYDFWDYVNCARCHLSYASDVGGPQVPFWLTECGHVLCNNHLSQSRLLLAVSHLSSRKLSIDSDRSCAQCGSRDIELVSLQRQVPVQFQHHLGLIFDAFLHRWIHPCQNGSWLFPTYWMELLMLPRYNIICALCFQCYSTSPPT